jgi:hypothetical protein
MNPADPNSAQGMANPTNDNLYLRSGSLAENFIANMGKSLTII